MASNFKIRNTWRDLINSESLTSAYNLSATYVVGAESEYKTITAALEAAEADGHILTGTPACIYVTPGTYVEDLTLGTAAVTVWGTSFNTTVISGNHTNSGYASFKSIGFEASSGTCFTSAGLATNMQDCFFELHGTAVGFASPTGTNSFIGCNLWGDSTGTFLSLSGDAEFNGASCIISNSYGSTSPLVVCGTTGVVRFMNPDIKGVSDTVYTVSVTAGEVEFFNGVVRNMNSTATGLGCFSLTGGQSYISGVYLQTDRSAAFGAGEGSIVQNGGDLEIGNCSFVGDYGNIRAAVSGTYTIIPVVMT